MLFYSLPEMFLEVGRQVYVRDNADTYLDTRDQKKINLLLQKCFVDEQ